MSLSTRLIEINPSTTCPTLTWQEMIYLHKNKLGLRGVLDEKQARQEQKNGGWGDAVSLATFAFPGTPKLQLREQVKRLHGLTDNGNLYDNQVLLSAYYFLCEEEEMNAYPKDKKTLQERLLAGIMHHVELCVKVFGSRGFILMSDAYADLPYDYESYPLGKCGKRSFTRDQVKALITPNTEDPWNSQTAYVAVLSTIKSLYYQRQLDCRSEQALLKLSLLTAPSPAQNKERPPIYSVDKKPGVKKRGCCIIL